MKEINAKRKVFREELVKIMPGYKWTVHKGVKRSEWDYITATGVISTGLSRISTLLITRVERGGFVEYKASSSGFGKRTPWLHSTTAPRLAMALRQLQEHYKAQAYIYISAAEHLQNARKANLP